MSYSVGSYLPVQEGSDAATCYQSDFVTLSSVLLHEQPVVVLFLEGALVSWSLGMDERDGHQDLRGSGYQSVIPYIHGRTELYCTSLSCLSLISFWPPPFSGRSL
jgi:hypothetical protein